MEQSKPIVLKGGWSGCVLTIAIVAARAFQPNSVPMEEWSFGSWLLMTLPVLWPTWLFAVSWSILLALELFGAIFRRRH